MKITKNRLKQIIKEELEDAIEPAQDSGGPEVDIQDAIQMLENELEMQDSYPDEYQSGAVFHVINRLHEALAKLGDPNKVIASIPASREGEPPYEMNQWHQDELDARDRAYKAFDKRNKK